MSSEETKKFKEFFWPVRVYYEDTDSGGVVYYANYLKFMERARTELLRSIGYQQDQLQQELGIIFAVHSANIQYKKPARFNDELNVITSIISLGKASIHFKQSIHLKSALDSGMSATVSTGLLSKAEIKIACLNAKKFTPQSIPASIIIKINKEFYCGS
ncbi:MAG: tol-pal system-associated acyl-CoA thioesterase [Gammaproteobacteria bacterium]|nr:MAG: tol-pal system-associated acyl-CoA thioesterase [Gammaproteobacteria bacterium]